MDVALAVLHVLMAQVRGNPEGINPLAGKVEAAAMPEDMRIDWTRETGPLANRLQ
jgi:hypothetical protein